MYVCLCNALTDRHVRHAASQGADRPSEVYRACGCAAQCGACAKSLRRLVDETIDLLTRPPLVQAE